MSRDSSAALYADLHADITIQINFVRPILRWTTAQETFFSLVYSTLSPRINVKLGDLSVVGGDNLGQIFARYSLFGGASTVSLYSDRLVASFVGVKPGDTFLLADICRSIHNGLQREFEHLGMLSFDYRVQEHKRILGPVTASQFLFRFAHPGIKMLVDSTSTKYEPGLRMRLISDAATMDFSMERSHHFPDSVFLLSHVIVSVASTYPSYEAKYKIVNDTISFALAAVGLRQENSVESEA